MKQAPNLQSGKNGRDRPNRQNGPNGGPNAGPNRRQRAPGERARRLLEKLAQGQDIGELAQRMKRPRPQLEQQLAGLLGKLGVSSVAAALKALNGSPAAAAAAEEVLPADAAEADDDDNNDAADGGTAEAGAETPAA